MKWSPKLKVLKKYFCLLNWENGEWCKDVPGWGYNVSQIYNDISIIANDSSSFLLIPNDPHQIERGNFQGRDP